MQKELSVFRSEGRKLWSKQNELDRIEIVTVEAAETLIRQAYIQLGNAKNQYLLPLPFLPTITLCFGLKRTSVRMMSTEVWRRISLVMCIPERFDFILASKASKAGDDELFDVHTVVCTYHNACKNNESIRLDFIAKGAKRSDLSL